MIVLKHAGLSQAESETLFKLLEGFGVKEIEEDLADEYVSMICLDMPFAYNLEFFKKLGFDRWEELKMLLKNIRWRRGNKEFKLVISFINNPTIQFSLITDSDRVMSKALDTIEYMVDNLTLQLKNVSIAGIKLITYKFDTQIYRWNINNVIDNDGIKYKYVNNELIKL